MAVVQGQGFPKAKWTFYHRLSAIVSVIRLLVRSGSFASPCQSGMRFREILESLSLALEVEPAER
jgi:hypothetical protein